MKQTRVVFNLLCLLAAASSSHAFETLLYTTEECSGSSTDHKPKVSDGCQTSRGGTVSGIINKWTSEDDNKLVIATYSDEKCCHAKQIQTIDWEDGCIKLEGTMNSWRVLDPDDPDKGKEGEDYSKC